MRLPTASIGVGPPGERSGEQPDGHDAHHRNDGQFRGQPSSAGDALCPHEPVGVSFELGRDQRRSPERADGGGYADEDGAEEPQPDVHTGQFAGAFTRVHLGDVVPAREQRHEHGHGGGAGEERLGAKLAPGEPRHWVLSTLRKVRRVGAEDSM